MRVLGFCLTVWLGLIGYQVEAASVGEKNLLVEELTPSQHMAQKDAYGGMMTAGDMVDCWMHATCSPAFTAAIEDVRPIRPPLARQPGRAVVYDSLAAPPTAPPPRA